MLSIQSRPVVFRNKAEKAAGNAFGRPHRSSRNPRPAVFFVLGMLNGIDAF